MSAFPSEGGFVRKLAIFSVFSADDPIKQQNGTFIKVPISINHIRFLIISYLRFGKPKTDFEWYFSDIIDIDMA